MKVSRGILYLADLSPRVGTESGKIRPVLVIQTDLLNEVEHPSTWVLPCTTRLSGENLLRVPLPRGVAGNPRDCEVMIDPETGGPHTAHTTNPVPFVVLDPDGDRPLRGGGALFDVGPTILSMLGIESPSEMTGRDLRVMA